MLQLNLGDLDLTSEEFILDEVDSELSPPSLFSRLGGVFARLSWLQGGPGGCTPPLSSSPTHLMLPVRLST